MSFYNDLQFADNLHNYCICSILDHYSCEVIMIIASWNKHNGKLLLGHNL